TNQANVFGTSAGADHRCIRIVANEINGMLLKNARWNFRQNFAAEVFDGLYIRRMAEVSDEEDSFPLCKRNCRSIDIFSVSNRVSYRPSHQVVYEAGFFVGNGPHSICGCINIQLAPHLMGVFGTDDRRRSVGFGYAENPPGLS